MISNELSRDLLKNIAFELKVEDISEILPSIHKINQVVLAVSQLDNFVKNICTDVLEVEAKNGNNYSAVDVPFIIKRWKSIIDKYYNNQFYFFIFYITLSFL